MIESKIHLILGILIVTGILVGFTTSLLIAPKVTSGRGRLIDLIDLIKMFNLRNRCNILVESRTINISNNYSLEIYSRSAIIDVNTWDNKQVHVNIYECQSISGKPRYNITYDKNNNTVKILVEEYRVEVYLPKNTEVKDLKVIVDSGVVDINYEDITVNNSYYRLNNGVLNIEAREQITRNIVVDAYNGVLDLEAYYSEYTGNCSINVEVYSGTVQIDAVIPSDAKVFFNGVVENGIADAELDHVRVGTNYVEEGYSSSNARFNLNYHVYNGMLEVGVNHE